MRVRIILNFGLEGALNGHKQSYDAFLRSFGARQRMGASYTQLSDDPFTFDASVTPKHAHELEKATYVLSIKKEESSHVSRNSQRTVFYRARIRDINPDLHEEHFTRF